MKFFSLLTVALLFTLSSSAQLNYKFQKKRNFRTESTLTANAGPDLTVYAGESVRLDGSASKGAVNFRWATGDGHTINSILKAPHAYTKPGVYTAELTVTDTAGRTSRDTAIVTVQAVDAAIGHTITLTDSGNPEVNKQILQQALDTAALNPSANEIIVPAGMVINDTIYMPARPASFGTYVTIRSSRSGELPEGRRVTKVDRDKMFRINAQPAGSPGGVEHFAILIGTSTNYFRFVGMDIVRTGSTTSYKNDIIGVVWDWQSGETRRPSHFILDRVIIDGNGTGVTLGYAPNGESFSLLNSAIYDIKSPGTESKAVGMWSGAGNLAVINNRLEAASINTLIGGDYTDTSNMMDGIVFRGNDSWKNPNWINSDGTSKGYGIKNLFELKAGTNVVADGNTFENNWADAQAGSSILFTVRGDGQPLLTIRNVSFRHNIIRNVHSGLSILPLDYLSASTEVQNIYFEQNLMLNVGGRAFMLLPMANGGGKNIHIKHNTVRMRPGAGQVVTMDGDGKMQAFIESNDLGYAGEYGVFGSGTSEGISTVQQYLTTDSTFKNNLMSFEGRSYMTSLNYALSRYPTETFAMYFSFTAFDSYNADGTPLSHIVGTDGLIVGVTKGAVPLASSTSSATSSAPEPVPSPAPPNMEFPKPFSENRNIKKTSWN